MRKAPLNVAQRTICVVALAGILWLVGAYLTAPVTPFSGWTGYAPLSVVGPRDGLTSVANLFVWFGLVLAWGAGSLLVFSGAWRRRGREPGQAAGESAAGPPDPGSS